MTTLTIGRAALGLALACSSSAPSWGALQLHQSRDFAEEFRAAFPQPVEISPDATHILLRAKEPGDLRAERLSVQRIADGKIQGTLRVPAPVLRARWSPDGTAVVFFCRKPDSNVRELFIWRTGDSHARPCEIPRSIAQPEVRWSPDSRRVAFTSMPESLIVVDVAKGTHVVYGQKARTFDWSSDSRQIALITGKGDAVRIINAADATTVRDLAPLAETSLVEISWQRGPGLLLHYSDDKAKTSRLFLADAQTGEHQLLHAATHPIRDIHRTHGGLVCSFRTGARKSALLWTAIDAPPRAIEGQGTIAVHHVEGDSVIALQTSAVASRFVRLPVGSHPAQILFGHESPLGSELVEGEVHFPVPNAATTPGWLARTPKADRPAAVIVLSTGGPDLDWPPERWAETQVYLNHGAHVLHLLVDLKSQPAETIHAACRHLRDELGVPLERIAVTGLSNAAAAAVLAAQADPAAFGVLVTTGLLAAKPPPADFAAQAEHPAVLSFHGERDPYLPPEKSHQLLSAALSPLFSSADNTLWHVFPGEYHSLLFDENRAAVISTTLVVLGLLAAPAP